MFVIFSLLLFASNNKSLIFLVVTHRFLPIVSQAVTRELKEQSTLLQAARAKLRRRKQASGLTCLNPAPAPALLLPGSTPPASVTGPEKKQSNNNNNNHNHHANGDAQQQQQQQQAQTKKRQMEELVRKVCEKMKIENLNAMEKKGKTNWIFFRFFF